jgi:hypothetical protein
MRRMLAATAAEFLELQPFRRRLPVLGRRIIPLFAITALQRNNFSGHRSLLKFNAEGKIQNAELTFNIASIFLLLHSYFLLLTSDLPYVTISAIVPAPTVCPPSRMAKRNPFSIATGVINSITSETLSPGITISVPAGNSATPVTSVVRK